MNTPARSGGDGWGGGVRRYGAADLRRLRFIRAAQGAGFTLDEIGDLLALGESDDPPRVRALARQRIAALDAKIAQMTQTRAALARPEDPYAKRGTGPCPSPAAFEPPCT